MPNKFFLKQLYGSKLLMIWNIKKNYKILSNYFWYE